VGLHDGVRDEGRRDLASAEPTSVEALDGVLGGVDRVELDVDLSLGVLFDLDCIDLAVLLSTFSFYFFSEVLFPVGVVPIPVRG